VCIIISLRAQFSSCACKISPARFLRPLYGYYYGIGAVWNEEAAGTINMVLHLHIQTLFAPSCIFICEPRHYSEISFQH